MAHLFLSIFGLGSDLRAEVVDLVNQPLTDASQRHGRQLLQITVGELLVSALTHLRGQNVTHKVGGLIQHSAEPAQYVPCQNNHSGGWNYNSVSQGLCTGASIFHKIYYQGTMVQGSDAQRVY